MDDKELMHIYQARPKRCVLVFEDIDEMNIVRESSMVTVPTNSLATSSSSGARNDSDTTVSVSSLSSVAVGVGGKENKIPLPPKKARVTLSGLLNVLDGLGSKEGYIATITVNAPKSLDPALYRAGRIDIKIYLGFSTKVIAAIIYTRILGDDKRSRFS